MVYIFYLKDFVVFVTVKATPCPPINCMLYILFIFNGTTFIIGKISYTIHIWVLEVEKIHTLLRNLHAIAMRAEKYHLLPLLRNIYLLLTCNIPI